MYETDPAPPARVTKRDGRVVSFEADKISRALFAAGESLGRPDAFLARELADGVVHFLAAEDDGTTLTTARVAEVAFQVVRELGHPALAEAFAAYGRRRESGPSQPDAVSRGGVELRYPPDMPPADVLAACVRSYSLQSVYARDLVAAQADGLLTLTGLDHPCELEGCVLGPWSSEGAAAAGLADAVEAARRIAGRFVVLDGPEYGLARSEEPDVRSFARELVVGLRIARLSAVVNLNAAEPPPRDGQLAGGPLFECEGDGGASVRRLALADGLFEELRRTAGGQLRVDWHLGASDFAPEARDRLERVARAAVEGGPLAFAFDRPGRTVALAEGIDRENPAVLLTVDLHLAKLAEQASVFGDPERFLGKISSLARLALSAGVQKRAFLRRQERSRVDATRGETALSAGFLLERARLVVSPAGLDEIARTFTGGDLSPEFASRVVTRLRDVLRHEGRQVLLETCVDGPAAFTPAGDVPAAVEVSRTGEPSAVRDKLRPAGRLHPAAGAGTLTLYFPDGNPPDAGQAAEYLRLAWQRGEVVRLRFAREIGFTSG